MKKQRAYLLDKSYISFSYSAFIRTTLFNNCCFMELKIHSLDEFFLRFALFLLSVYTGNGKRPDPYLRHNSAFLPLFHHDLHIACHIFQI